MEERLAFCVTAQCEVEIAVEYQGETHHYNHSFIQELTGDGYVVFDVHYIDPELDAVNVSEVTVPLDYVVRLARIKRSTKS